jgi:hypothetical protein
MNEWLKSIPLYWGTVMAVAGFVAILVWAWFRPRDYIFRGAADRRWWRDLRIWATLLLILQIVLYLIF